MRKRMLHDRIWESDQFAVLTIKERLLFIALITGADDEGCFRADPKHLRRKAFYGDRVSVNQVQKMLDHLQEVGLVVLGVTKKGMAGLHPNWWDYQSLRRDRSKPSKYSDLLVANGLTPRITIAAQDKRTEDKQSEYNLVKESEDLGFESLFS